MLCYGDGGTAHGNGGTGQGKLKKCCRQNRANELKIAGLARMKADCQTEEAVFHGRRVRQFGARPQSDG